MIHTYPHFAIEWVSSCLCLTILIPLRYRKDAPTTNCKELHNFSKICLESHLFWLKIFWFASISDNETKFIHKWIGYHIPKRDLFRMIEFKLPIKADNRTFQIYPFRLMWATCDSNPFHISIIEFHFKSVDVPFFNESINL